MVHAHSPLTRGHHDEAADSTTLPASAALLMLHRPGESDDPGAARLMQAWRESGRPVIHLLRIGATPSGPGSSLSNETRPGAGEVVIEAPGDDAFLDTGLGPFLADRGIDTLVVAGGGAAAAGIARAAKRLGLRAIVAADGDAVLAVH